MEVFRSCFLVKVNLYVVIPTLSTKQEYLSLTCTPWENFSPTDSQTRTTQIKEVKPESNAKFLCVLKRYNKHFPLKVDKSFSLAIA